MFFFPNLCAFNPEFQQKKKYLYVIKFHYFANNNSVQRLKESLGYERRGPKG